MKTILVGLALVSFLGCASAEQKMESKQDYRRAQVEAIKVQSDARISRDQVSALEKQAMWNALAEVVKANPEAASNVAIVAAVAAARDGGDGGQSTSEGMALIKTERDVTALDWAKVLTGPVLGTVTQVGIAALNTDLQKEISRNNTSVDIVEAEIEGKIYDAVGVMASTPRSTVTVSDSASYIGGDSAVSTETNTTTSTTTSTTTTTTTDDDIYVINTSAADADDQVDDLLSEVDSFGLPDDDTVDVDDGSDDSSDDSGSDGSDDGGEEESEEGGEEVDCDSVQFSPAPPECSV
jgi:hypothetical protein